MSHPYKTREGGATVTVFVPYDCQNHCPFCVNKIEYADTTGFSLDRICQSIRRLHAVTPRCDFVFTGGEPLADLEALQVMLDCIEPGHRVFINTTLPVFQGRTEDELVDFLNRNRDALTCVNVSRHLRSYVVESNDAIFGRLQVPCRINSVLFGGYTREQLLAFVRRFGPTNTPIQFRCDYTTTTLENLYDETEDHILADLRAVLTPTIMEGCRIRCNYEFLDGDHVVSYHKTLPYSTITETGPDGVTYDILYDVLIKQTGEMHSDWNGTPLDFEAYQKVVYEPYDLHRMIG